MDEKEMMNYQAAAVMGRTAYMTGQNNEINTLLSELTNPEQDIYEVELSLKGVEIDENGNKKQVSEPLLNDKGVANMIKLMRSMVSRVMYMSNLEEDQIRIMTQELGEQIVSDLVFHKVEYQIKDFNDMTTIRTIITYKAFESGMAALENGFRRFLKSGIVETTINTQGNPMKGGKGGGLGSLLGFGKK
jgi:predicted hydrocarbon binding protein